MSLVSNQDVRDRAKKAQVPHWRIADALGITEFTFSRMLRYELPDEKKDKILDIIDRLREEA